MNSVLPLITPGKLAARLGEDPPVLLDVRWRLAGPSAAEDYRQAHLPGARFVDLDADLAGPPGTGGRHPLPDPDRLVARLAELGVREDRTVVAYDDADGSVAARAWWLLRWLGHPADRVAVLDGGYSAWVADGYPVTAEVPAAEPGRLTARAGSMPVIDADGAAESGSGGLLLDARAPARYLGETEPVDPRPGHIPGAHNAPFALHLGPDGRWRPPAELAEHYRGLGVDEAGPVAAYCGSGVTATSVVLALEYAGLCPPDRPAALYAGSWSQWSADPARPAAVGPEPPRSGEPS
jgi:thiosulfate/3-mercaptopyruvate sulfurtransferase